MSMGTFNNHEDRNTVLVVFGIIGTSLLLMYVFLFYPMQQSDLKMLADLKASIAADAKETKIEQEKLKSMDCSELKDAIGNNEFTELSQQANNQYLGRCT